MRFALPLHHAPITVARFPVAWCCVCSQPALLVAAFVPSCVCFGCGSVRCGAVRCGSGAAWSRNVPSAFAVWLLHVRVTPSTTTCDLEAWAAHASLLARPLSHPHQVPPYRVDMYMWVTAAQAWVL